MEMASPAVLHNSQLNCRRNFILDVCSDSHGTSTSFHDKILIHLKALAAGWLGVTLGITESGVQSKAIK